MNKYEILYILAGAATEEVREKQIKRFEDLVVSSGGSVEKIDKWGMKKFAYPINYKTEGYYVLMNFSAKADFPVEIERQMLNTEEVVRFMTVRKD